MKNDKVAPANPPHRPERDSETNGVADFFTWANLEGSKYRDFSASREKSRADARERSAIDRSRVEDAATAGPPSNEEKRIISGQRTPAESPLVRRKFATLRGGRATTAKRTQHPPAQGDSSRWVALKGTFSSAEGYTRDDLPTPHLDLPALAFFSLAGGTGKTSLTAAMGCLLATEGVSSLLVDTHLYGLLPLFFGARELSPGTSRAFSSPDAAPVRVMTLETSHREAERPLAEQISHHVNGIDHILIDVSTASLALLREALSLSPTLLVVLAPDMASVVSLESLQRALQQMEHETDREISTFFVLNKFDPSLRLHRDIRDRLTRQLGQQFLPFAIHRSHAVSEALAGGLTIVDYAPDSQTVEDLRDLAQWIHELVRPAVNETPDVRWRQC